MEPKGANCSKCSKPYSVERVHYCSDCLRKCRDRISELEAQVAETQDDLDSLYEDRDFWKRRARVLKDQSNKPNEIIPTPQIPRKGEGTVTDWKGMYGTLYKEWEKQMDAFEEWWKERRRGIGPHAVKAARGWARIGFLAGRGHRREEVEALNAELEKERQHSDSLERLLAARHGEGWEHLTIAQADRIRSEGE